MATKTKCPIKHLKMKPMCEHPKRQPAKHKLSPADEKALHQFARRLVVAGDILYKKVPREKAERVVRRKWLQIATAIR